MLHGSKVLKWYCKNAKTAFQYTGIPLEFYWNRVGKGLHDGSKQVIVP